MTVQVLRRDPGVACLALATREDTVKLAWQVGLWLIGVPVAAFFLGRALTRANAGR